MNADDDQEGNDQASKSVGEADTANTLKRRWDDLNDYAAGSSGIGSFEEDLPDSKRLRQSTDPMDRNLSDKAGPSGSESFEEEDPHGS